MTEEMKNKLQTTQRRMLRMTMQTKRKAKQGVAAAHAANVDDIADDEAHDPESEPEADTTEANLQDSSEQEEGSYDADCNPSLNSVPQHDETTEDELEPCVEYVVRTTHTADDLLTIFGITPWIARQSRPHWKPNTTTTAGQGSFQSGAISTKQKGCRKRGRPAKKVGRRHHFQSATKESVWRQQRTHKRIDLAHCGI